MGFNGAGWDLMELGEFDLVEKGTAGLLAGFSPVRKLYFDLSWFILDLHLESCCLWCVFYLFDRNAQPHANQLWNSSVDGNFDTLIKVQRLPSRIATIT